jgi:hypothetical protein
VTHSFPLRRDRPWKWLLQRIGVRPGAAQVELLPDGRLVATFGPMRLETPLENVAEYRLTGPYRWWKAIGPRGSMADHGFTFGTSARGGVCVCFRSWVEGGWVRGGRVESLTVTVEDIDGLATALARRGIPGRDERRA